MFDAIRAVQSVTDAPYHRPQPVEARSSKPVFSLDLAAPVPPVSYAAPIQPAYNASALSVIFKYNGNKSIWKNNIGAGKKIIKMLQLFGR